MKRAVREMYANREQHSWLVLKFALVRVVVLLATEAAALQAADKQSTPAVDQLAVSCQFVSCL